MFKKQNSNSKSRLVFNRQRQHDKDNGLWMIDWDSLRSLCLFFIAKRLPFYLLAFTTLILLIVPYSMEGRLELFKKAAPDAPPPSSASVARLQQPAQQQLYQTTTNGLALASNENSSMFGNHRVLLAAATAAAAGANATTAAAAVGSPLDVKEKPKKPGSAFVSPAAAAAPAGRSVGRSVGYSRMEIHHCPS
jgi:hypothetical protein